jgi:outer membrane protein assembly factor BamA
MDSLRRYFNRALTPWSSLVVLVFQSLASAQQATTDDSPRTETKATGTETTVDGSVENLEIHPRTSPPNQPVDSKEIADTTGASTTPSAELQVSTDLPKPKPITTDDESRVRYQLEQIELRGNSRTKAKVILRYLPFLPGKELDVDDPEFTLARYRLLGTGFFRDVQFSLRKGTKRGKVVLVVEVTERNSVVLNGLWMGLSADANEQGEKRPLTAYGGVDFAETNLAGTGISLGGALGLAKDQYALSVRFLDPGYLLGSPWMVSGSLVYNNAVDFFGSGVVKFTPRRTDRLYNTDAAVVPYSRFGGSIGFGRDLGVSTQLWLNYRLETIRADVPLYAEQDGRGKVEPIDFDILQGRSVFSAIRANFQYDTRDHPFLPTRGWLVNTWGELGLAPLGSDYDYQRFDISVSKWWKVRGTSHVLRLQSFAGVMSGHVPFFEQYYVGDFCDFLPARMLGLNVDSRPPNDFLHTAIYSVRYGHYAASLRGEYRVPVYRGHRSVYGIDFFLSAGVWSVANRRDLFDPGPAYEGLRSIPVDLTANVGFRMDTSAGGLVFSFANALGFLPVRTVRSGN